MTRRRHPRRIKLVRPRLQLKLIGWFVGVSSIALLLQFLLLGWFMQELALSRPVGGPELAAAANDELLRALALSFLFLLPTSLTVGVLVTFRIAGPIYRFETHLGQIARGEDPGPCRIRRGDELQQLCLHINLAVERLRQDGERARRAERPPELAEREA